MPALREEAPIADQDFSYMFDGAGPDAVPQSSMFAVLGGYGGETQSVGQEWDQRTVGGDMFGGGWEGGPNQRFEAEQSRTMATSLMAGFQEQQGRTVSASSSMEFPPSSPSPQTNSTYASAPTPSTPSRRHVSPSSVLVTPPRTHRRPQPPPPTTPLFTSRPSTATSSSSRPTSPPLLTSTPLPNRSRKISPLPSKKSSSSSASSTPAPAHLARAQAVVALRQAEQDAERALYRRTKASRKVDPFLASVLIQGWEPLATSEAALIVATPTPAPAPAPTPRPIARLPSSSASSSPNLVRAQPARVQRPAIEAPIPAGGYTTFINYTMDDAERLLMGVAPSGAPQPRKTSAPSAPKKRRGDEMEKDSQGKRRAT